MNAWESLYSINILYIEMTIMIACTGLVNFVVTISAEYSVECCTTGEMHAVLLDNLELVDVETKTSVFIRYAQVRVKVLILSGKELAI